MSSCRAHGSSKVPYAGVCVGCLQKGLQQQPAPTWLPKWPAESSYWTCAKSPNVTRLTMANRIDAACTAAEAGTC